VAEDEHLIAAHLAVMLSDLGYTVLAATDGEEAVALAQAGAPDIALFDIRMPKLDGITAAERVFKELLVPVVILSAYSDADQIRATLDVVWARYRGYIDQAVEVEQLTRRLAERKTIEQAKWVLVSRRGMSEPDAAHWINRQARGTRQTAMDVALAIIRTGGE
jgi:response regulator NasT